MSKRLAETQTTKVTVRVREDLVDAYDDTLDGQSRSEAIREHMRERSGKTTDDHLPDDDRLRAALQAIRRATDPDGCIPTNVAKSRAAEATRVGTKDAKRTIIRPLDEQGYLEVVTFGKLRVTVDAHEPQEVTA